MSEDNQWYVDPNSGAAPQPGGVVAGPVQTEGSPDPKTLGDPDADPVVSHTRETQAAPAPVAPGKPGKPADAPGKDYSDLLDKNLDDVQKYLEEHPEERDAVVAAEKQGKGRKGIVES